MTLPTTTTTTTTTTASDHSRHPPPRRQVALKHVTLAEGAGLAAVEPLLDAVAVEAVVARQHGDLLALLKVAETDCADVLAIAVTVATIISGEFVAARNLTSAARRCVRLLLLLLLLLLPLLLRLLPTRAAPALHRRVCSTAVSVAVFPSC